MLIHQFSYYIVLTTISLTSFGEQFMGFLSLGVHFSGYIQATDLSSDRWRLYLQPEKNNAGTTPAILQ